MISIFPKWKLYSMTMQPTHISSHYKLYNFYFQGFQEKITNLTQNFHLKRTKYEFSLNSIENAKTFDTQTTFFL